MNKNPVDRRPTWLLWVAGTGVLVLVGTVLALMQGDAPPIEKVFRPTRAGIEQAIMRRVRQGKTTRMMEFYGGWYTVGGKSHRMEFVSEPGTYHIGDTMWVLYDPANPPSNITYDHRNGAIHLDQAQLENVLLDFDAVKVYIDSLERARVGE